MLAIKEEKRIDASVNDCEHCFDLQNDIEEQLTVLGELSQNLFKLIMESASEQEESIMDRLKEEKDTDKFYDNMRIRVEKEKLFNLGNAIYAHKKNMENVVEKYRIAS